jgi:WD40 repeat protein
LEVYDDEKLARICDLKHNGTNGHTNRIFSVKYDPTMANVVYSGGWDCIVNIWDLRTGGVIGSISGP